MTQHAIQPTIKPTVSWIGARGGKWHAATVEEPEWGRRETAQCGITFEPLNVTWREMPPTNRRYICDHCAARIGLA